MEQKDLIFLFIFVLLCFVLLLVVMTIMRNPFQFPYMTIYIDISGKRNVKAEDYIDRYLINNKFDFIKLHEEKIKKWKKDCNYINRNLLGGLYRENPVKSRNYEAVKSSKKWENVGNSYIIPALLLYRYSYI